MANLKSKKKFGISLRHAEMVMALMQEHEETELGYTWTAVQVLGALKGSWGRYEPTVRQMGMFMHYSDFCQHASEMRGNGGAKVYRLKSGE
jgi:hypothetical protein